MGRPALTRARISEDETPKGKPFKVRPRNGAGKTASAPPGRGAATNTARLASSAASRHALNCAALSAPIKKYNSAAGKVLAKFRKVSIEYEVPPRVIS